MPTPTSSLASGAATRVGGAPSLGVLDSIVRDAIHDGQIPGAVLLVAEAGYGKTTLLADFSRRTRVRVLWFRLDRGDRDWVGFIAHLVAAVRVEIA